MLFQVNYTFKSGGSAKENEESSRRGLALFSKWEPPAGMDIKSFYARADGTGGSLIIETDNVRVLLDGPSKFGALNDFEIIPIVDIADAVEMAAQGQAWADSID